MQRTSAAVTFANRKSVERAFKDIYGYGIKAYCGAATLFAVSDDLKQRVSKVQGTFTIIYKVYFLIYNPNPSS